MTPLIGARSKLLLFRRYNESMVSESGQTLVDAGILVVTSGQNSSRFQAQNLKSANVAPLLPADEYCMARQTVGLGSER